MASERTPLLQEHTDQAEVDRQNWDDENRDRENFHSQFCMLVGVPPSNLPPGAKYPSSSPKSLYKRATNDRRHQSTTYFLTANISNGLLLTQVILGATLTALGASESSHILITIFGVLNTVIAGLVAYLKSRGQPMRARMYRDDLERVVDEIENSEVMWLGISRGVHGYDEIDTDQQVTVRSEVARLTRLYERAVKSNTMNNPDMYMSGGSFDGVQAGLRTQALPIQTAAPVPVIPAPVSAAPATDGAAVPAVAVAPAPAQVASDPDESPATAAKPEPTTVPETRKDNANGSLKDEKKADESIAAKDGADLTNSGRTGGKDADDAPPPEAFNHAVGSSKADVTGEGDAKSTENSRGSR